MDSNDSHMVTGVCSARPSLRRGDLVLVPAGARITRRLGPEERAEIEAGPWYGQLDSAGETRVAPRIIRHPVPVDTVMIVSRGRAEMPERFAGDPGGGACSLIDPSRGWAEVYAWRSSLLPLGD